MNNINKYFNVIVDGDQFIIKAESNKKQSAHATLKQLQSLVDSKKVLINETGVTISEIALKISENISSKKGLWIIIIDQILGLLIPTKLTAIRLLALSIFKSEFDERIKKQPKIKNSLTEEEKIDQISIRYNQRAANLEKKISAIEKKISFAEISRTTKKYEGVDQCLMAQKFEEGEAKGRAEGERTALNKVAENMVRQGFEIDRIIAVTGLSKEEIINLSN